MSNQLNVRLFLFFLLLSMLGDAVAEDLIVQVKSQAQEPGDMQLVIDGRTAGVSRAGIAYQQVDPGVINLEIRDASGNSLGQFPVDIPQEKNAEVVLSIVDGQVQITIDIYPPDTGEIKTGYLVGIIKSTFDDIPLEGARVSVVGSQDSAITDADGRFSMEVPRGVTTVEISHAEHETRTVDAIPVFSGESSLTDIVLKKVGYEKDVTEVMVFGVISGLPTASAAIERDSNTVMDVMNADDLARSGDSSAAGAIARVTGVAVVDDKFAVVRGLAGRYISSTLDGGLLPSTDFLRRDVPLDLFPSSILSTIQIEKSYRPELPGDTTGGIIAMQARGLPEDKEHAFAISTGLNTEVHGEDVLTYRGGDKDYLGIDDGQREIPDEVDQLTNYGRDRLPSVCLPPPLTIDGCVSSEEYAALSKTMPATYNTYTRSTDPELGLGYAYGDRYSLGFGDVGFYGALDYTHEWENRPNASETIYLKEGDAGFELAEEVNYSRSKRKIDLTGFFAFGWQDDLGNEVVSKTILLRKTSDTTRVTDTNDILEGQAYLDTVLQWVEQQMFTQKVAGKHFFGGEQNHVLDWHVGFSNTSRYEPDKRDYSYEGGYLTASRIFRRYTNLDEDAVDFGVDYEWEINLDAPVYPQLKAGIYSAEKSRELESARFGFAINSSVDRTQDIELVLAHENMDADAVRLSSQGLSTDYSEADDDVQAAYLSTETEFGESYALLLGARYEKAKQSLEYPMAGDGYQTEPLESTDVLPAVMLTWKPSDAMQFRAGVSQTLSRPGLTERSNTVFFDPDTDEKVVGNPHLENSEINNVDFRAEYYFSEEDSVSLALFYKQIDKPIEKTVSAGVRYGYTFRNSKSADLTGVEMDFKKAVMDSGDWYAYVAGNLTWIDSQVELDTMTAQLEGVDGSPRTSRPLQGQSEYLANIQIGFDNFEHGHSATILVNYFGDRINRVDNVATGDRYELGRTLVDAIYKYEITPSVVFKSKVSNIRDEKVVYESRGERRMSTEQYSNGISFSMGIAVEL